MWEQFGNVMDMIKKVQQHVNQQEKLLEDERIEVSGSDVLKIVVNGQQSVITIDINQKYLTPENALLIQDLLVATLNNALEKSRNMHKAAMGKLAGDLNLPNIPGLF